MAFSEFESKKYEMVARQFVERRRPPAHLRGKIDLSCRVRGQSVEIFHIRPLGNHPEGQVEEAVAKARYVKAHGIWKLYWLRADLRWHRYDPSPEANSLEEVLQIVGDDEYGCFFG